MTKHYPTRLCSLPCFDEKFENAHHHGKNATSDKDDEDATHIVQR